MKLDILKKPAAFVATKFARVGLKASNHAPEILVGAGILGGVAATVLACKATLKVHEVLEDARADLRDIEIGLERAEELDYTEQDATKDKATVYALTTVKVLRYYAPAVGVGALSVAMILKGHDIRCKRYLAAAAGWAASQVDYKNLLESVKQEYGEEAAQKLKWGLQDKTEEYEEPDENGLVTKGTREVTTVGTMPSLYSKVFDETCVEWRKDPIHNMMFLRGVQEECNKTLHKQGFLTLNEVYSALGFEPNAQYGNEAGWILGAGDDFVDFGLYDNLEENIQKRRFINGYERSVLLDFNCIGRIREYA